MIWSGEAVSEGHFGPLLDRKPGNALELPHVVGDERRAMCHGARGDHVVIRADGHALALEMRAYAGVVQGALVIEGKHLERQEEELGLEAIGAGVSRFLDTEEQLRLDHRWNSEDAGIARPEHAERVLVLAA